MLAVVAIFFLCLAIVLGAYWAFVVIPENKSTRTLRKRLKAEVVTEGRSPADALTRRAAPLSSLKGLDSLLPGRDASSSRCGGPSNTPAYRSRSGSSSSRRYSWPRQRFSS